MSDGHRMMQRQAYCGMSPREMCGELERHVERYGWDSFAFEKFEDMLTVYRHSPRPEIRTSRPKASPPARF